MHVVEIFTKSLAVIGGAALGFLGLGLVLRFCGMWLGSSMVPRRLVFALRGLGGIAGGWLVWFMVTSPGGSGLFGGGGSLLGGQGGEGPSPALSTRVSAPPAHQLDASETTLPIIMLGGDRVMGQRFYLLGADSKALTLDELTKAIQQRRAADKTIGRLEIRIYQNSVAENHTAVDMLKRWAADHDLKAYSLVFSRDWP